MTMMILMIIMLMVVVIMMINDDDWGAVWGRGERGHKIVPAAHRFSAQVL